MANDFSSDPNCEGWWTLDAYVGGGDMNFPDSSGNGNKLTNGNEEVEVDTTNQKEGAGCADFEASDFWSNYLYRNDGSLSADFPLKNGDTNKKISLVMWFKMESLPASGSNFRLYEKSGTNKYSFYTAIVTDASGDTWFYIGIGYNNGNSVEWIKCTLDTLSANIWYHFGVTFQDSDKSYRIRIWDDDAGALLGGTEQTGNSTNNINVEDGDLYIGRHHTDTGRYDGLMDEIVVFNDILTADEIDEIRDGTYGPEGNPYWYYQMMQRNTQMAMKPVDTALKVIVGPLIDDSDFKSREESVAYDAAGMEIDVIVEKADGTVTTTAVTPTDTGGDYDWAHTDQGFYELELPASGGASFNNTEEGVLRVVGYATGILPFSSPVYDIVPTAVYDAWVKGTDYLQVDMVQIKGTDATDQLDSDLNVRRSDLQVSLNSETDVICSDVLVALDSDIDVIQSDLQLIGSDVVVLHSHTIVIKSDIVNVVVPTVNRTEYTLETETVNGRPL